MYDFSQNIDDQASIGGDDGDDFGYGVDQEPFLAHGDEVIAESQAQYLPAIGEQDGVFSFFDTSMMRNWAGPEHWRSKPLTCKNILILMVSSSTHRKSKD